ncbi:MPND protein, partial [Crypturellus undulatus]|nr:MPND protein [Crypturellus undulatus]
TLRVLLRDGLLEPARGVLSIYYLVRATRRRGRPRGPRSNPLTPAGLPQGKKFVGDLGADGSITWQETGQVFNSPSAWATHCKRLVNPAKKSGCGWASVRYKGQRLDQYKAAWLRQHQPNAPATDEVGALGPASEGEEDELPEDDEEEVAPREGRAPEPPKKPEERSKKQPGRSLAEPPAAEHGPGAKRPENKPRVPVRYCTLGTRDAARNPQTLVEVTSFAAINKFQPFNVAISSNVLLLLDFHSHLTRSEVVGYLGGRWDTSAQRGAGRRGDGHCAPPPPPPPAPSVPPAGPYYPGNPGVESRIAPFWVMPPPEQRPNDYGIPMEVEVAYVQDGFLTADVLQEMTLLVEFYKGAPDLVRFQELWSQDQTYLDKLKVRGRAHGDSGTGRRGCDSRCPQGSLAARTPKDLGFAHVLEQIYGLLQQSG